MAKIDVSIIIPCYNEGFTFEKSVSKILTVLNLLKYNWEIVFVEDKSLDNTRKLVEKFSRKIRGLVFSPPVGGSKIKNCQVVYHNKNQGRGKTVSDGIHKSRGEICGYLDVDLEVDASYIPLFIEEVKNGADVVVGKRYYESDKNAIVRVLASKIYSLIVKAVLGIPISDTEAGYKFFRRSKILPVLGKTRDTHWFWDTEICARAYYAGLSIREIPVLFIRRHDKKSTVKLIPDTWAYLASIIKFRVEASK